MFPNAFLLFWDAWVAENNALRQDHSCPRQSPFLHEVVCLLHSVWVGLIAFQRFSPGFGALGTSTSSNPPRGPHVFWWDTAQLRVTVLLCPHAQDLCLLAQGSRALLCQRMPAPHASLSVPASVFLPSPAEALRHLRLWSLPHLLWAGLRGLWSLNQQQPEWRRLGYTWRKAKALSTLPLPSLIIAYYCKISEVILESPEKSRFLFILLTAILSTSRTVSGRVMGSQFVDWINKSRGMENFVTKC